MALNLSGTSGITGAGIGTIGPSGANVTGVGTFTQVEIDDKIVHVGDTNTTIRFPTTDAVSVETAGSEAARIDSSQRLLVGHTSSHADLHGKIQIAGAASQSLDVARYTANAHPPYINLYKSRNASTGGNTVVQDDDTVGYISAAGNDGSGFHSAAGIAFRIDGTPGDNDMPGRIDFETVPDGGTTLTNRLSIQSGGDVKVVTGNVIIGTSGKGIDFSATANATVMNEGYSTTAPSMDNELLKTYERGTWTGNIRGYDHAGGAGWGNVATTAGTNSATGRYIRIGNVVHCWIRFTGITWDTSWTYPSIIGVPFGHNHYDGAGGFCIAQDTNMFTDSTGTVMGNVWGSAGNTVGQKPNGSTNLTFDTSNSNRHMYASMTFYTSTGG